MTADGTTAVKMEGMELPLAWLVAMWAQAEEEQEEILLPPTLVSDFQLPHAHPQLRLARTHAHNNFPVGSSSNSPPNLRLFLIEGCSEVLGKSVSEG